MRPPQAICSHRAVNGCQKFPVEMLEAVARALDVLLGHADELVVLPLEEQDPARLGLRLFRVDQARAHDEVGVGVVAQPAREEAHSVLLLHQLVGVQDLEGVLVNDE